jgi:hypothetical protein
MYVCMQYVNIFLTVLGFEPRALCLFYTYSILCTGSSPLFIFPLFKHYLVGFITISSYKCKYADI